MSKLSAFDMFSNSEVKKDEEAMMGSFTTVRSKTVKQVVMATTVYEEHGESGDDDSINNRGSEVEEIVSADKSAIVDK